MAKRQTFKQRPVVDARPEKLIPMDEDEFKNF
jgi:hypothetical protein